jgi:hypothetical protein
MHRPKVSQLVLERIPLQRFLAMSANDLRVLLDELPTSRERRKSPLNADAIHSLIRVMDRASHTSVSALGLGAAKAWAARVGVS